MPLGILMWWWSLIFLKTNKKETSVHDVGMLEKFNWELLRSCILLWKWTTLNDHCGKIKFYSFSKFCMLNVFNTSVFILEFWICTFFFLFFGRKGPKCRVFTSLLFPGTSIQAKKSKFKKNAAHLDDFLNYDCVCNEWAWMAHFIISKM